MEKSNNLMMPVAVVIAGLIIGGAVMSTSDKGAPSRVAQAPSGNQPVPSQLSGSTDAVDPITDQDHIAGNPDAAVVVVEYSDFECPFCKRFHETMNQVIDEYGDNGDVAWVYRQFPIDQLHSKARLESNISECVADVGGNDAFWAFTNRFYELTPSNNQTDLDTVIPQILGEIGIDKLAVQSCVDSDKYATHIQDDVDNAAETGGRGTPWSIVIGPDGTTYPLSGAQPYAAVKQIIDLALSNK